MKSKLSLVLLIILALFLTGCLNEDYQYDEDRNKPIEEPVTTNFVSYSNEYDIKNKDVDFHFLEDNELLYLDVEDYLKLLRGAYLSTEFEIIKDYTNSKLTIIIYYHHSDTQADLYSLEIDFELDTFYTDSLDFYSVYLNEPETEYSLGLKNLDTIGIEGTSVTYDLAKYDFDLVIQNESFLVPLTILNLIFNQNIYLDLYFNGEVIYAIDSVEAGSPELMRKIMKSKKNEETVPKSIAVATKNYLAFVLDYFYGPKEEKGVTTGYDFIQKYDSSLNTHTSRAVNNVIYELNDLHSSYISKGYYNNKNLELTFPTYHNTTVKAYYDYLQNTANEAYKQYGLKNGEINFPDHELIGMKTAVVYINSFDLDTPEKFEKTLDNLHIKVENVVIDLSLNSGGNLGAVLRTFAVITNDVLSYHIQNPLDGSKYTYSVQGIKPANKKYNYVIKTSKITFSAANLMASMAKEMGITVIGEKTSGGASAINFFVPPDGSMFVLSSNSILSTYQDEQYYSIEQGVEPDIYINGIYNHEEIYKVMKQLFNN